MGLPTCDLGKWNTKVGRKHQRGPSPGAALPLPAAPFHSSFGLACPPAHLPLGELSLEAGTTTRDFTQLNELQCRYPRRLVVLGFPCNQFGHQENCQNEEILNSLKYVRPGGGFQPTFTLVQKCEVNGQNEHPVFAYLKDKLPYPYDDPFSLMTDPKYIIWSPVRRSDVSWNFEKFLIGPEGEPFRRYSRTFPTINIEPDIKRLLKVAI
ncbi:RAB15, member RAS oncogene family [Phyllostomus discolor]|uniref:Glutathione peroxidase n=1 Tax=Phyllostomus discolor TaxID=89673 RepID=A0A834BGQ9_9CHIR|nr:RAB15, member RAS oncogene family [Phyllostomus discolor]